MKKLLFVTLGHLSMGEFTVAFEFCKGLSQEEFEILFLTSDKGVRYLEENNIKYVCLDKSSSKLDHENQLKNQKLVERLMTQFQPDYVIASDIYTLWYSASWTGIDLDTFNVYDVQIGSFDSYAFSSTNFIQDFYGGYNVVIPDHINKCDFVIRYCPINKIKAAEANIKYTYLFKERIVLTEKLKQDFNHRFRPNNEKVIFITNSIWENLNINRLPALTSLINWTPKIMLNYICQLKEKITVIHVGPSDYQTIIANSSINYYYYPYIEAEIFDGYLACSDLYLTSNIIASTLVKSIYANVPAVVLQNDKIINFEHLKEQLERMPDWYKNMASEVKIAYPYHLFPFGWYIFLKPLLENNEYLNTFVQAGLFHNMKTVNVIRTYLFDKNKRSELIERQNAYINKISQLPSPKEVIDSLNNCF